MNTQWFVHTTRNWIVRVTVLLFLAAAVSCVLIVDKGTLSTIFEKEKVTNLKATPGTTQIQLGWTNPRAAEAGKIEIRYKTIGTRHWNYAEVRINKRGEPQAYTIPNLRRNTGYTFEVCAVYTDGGKSDYESVAATTN